MEKLKCNRCKINFKVKDIFIPESELEIHIFPFTTEIEVLKEARLILTGVVHKKCGSILKYYISTNDGIIGHLI